MPTVTPNSSMKVTSPVALPAGATLSMDVLLRLTVEQGASDLHLSVNAPPHLRVDGDLVPVEVPPLKAEDIRRLGYSLISEERAKRFEEMRELDFSFSVEGLARFRGNYFYQRDAMGVAIRMLPFVIMTFEQCGLPVPIVTDFCRKPRGLVLVTGATGSGKSTSLASMINMINHEHRCHIVTIEDPIEYVHENHKSVIDQREVGEDTRSFGQALKHVLRQDPDVILIGEMRDIETIEAALTIAETGHLVLATLHTSDAVQTVNRIIDVFPAHQQNQVRTQLSFVLLGILSQQLLPRLTGRGRLLACEVLVANHAVRSLIRDQKVHQLYSIIQTGQKEGMQTMNQSLYTLCANRLIGYEEALGRSSDPEELKRMIKVGGVI